MASYWLTFKPLGPRASRGWPIESLRDLIRRFELDPQNTTEWWRFVSYKSVQDGDRVYLFKQLPNPRGIFGFVQIVGTPKRRATPTDSTVTWRAEIRFERLVDPTRKFLIPLESMNTSEFANLVNAHASGGGVSSEIAAELEERLGISTRNNTTFDPTGLKDERERVLREIHARRGQPEFRAKLFEAYSGRCVITGCGISDILEAAHLSPYRGNQTNQVSNGILLRADIHTLYDCGLIAIEPDTRKILISSSLIGSEYEIFAGVGVSEPLKSSDRPQTELLRVCFNRFKLE